MKKIEVELSLTHEPTNYYRFIVSEYMVNAVEHVFYIAEDRCEIKSGLFVLYEETSQGISIAVPNEQLEDLSWRVVDE